MPTQVSPVTIAGIKSSLLELKRNLTLDIDDNEIPQNEIDSAHFWNAVACVDQAINNLTLAETMRHVVTVASKVTP